MLFNKETKFTLFKKVAIIFVTVFMLFSTLATNVSAATFDNARTISFGTRYTNYIYDSEDYKTYKFNTSKSGRVKINVCTYDEGLELYLYDNNGDEIDYYSLDYNSNIGYKQNYYEIYLPKGTYYFTIKKSYGADPKKYYVQTYFTDANSNFQNIHNSFSNAPSISLNTTYQDVAYPNEMNFQNNNLYKFTVNSSNIHLYIKSYIKNGLKYNIYDSNGNEYSYGNIDETTAAGYNTLNKSIYFSKGTYYLSITPASWGNIKNHQGVYQFKLTSSTYLKLNKNTKVVYVLKGYSTTLKASTNSKNKIKWTSNNNSIAKVTQNGTITGLKPGTAYIRATVDGITASCKVTVKRPSMTITQPSITLTKGKSKTVAVRTFPTTSAIKYSSTNSRIARVTSKGSIRGVRSGTCRIRVTANGVSDYINVRVK